MKTAVINLLHRTDRLREVERELSYFGIENYTVFAAYSEPNALVGNARSHYELLQKGYELIFEDDVFFDSQLPELLTVIKQLPPNYDILYLGGNVVDVINRFSDKLHRCTAAWGSFAILYSAKGRQYVLDNYNINAVPFIIYDEWLRVQSKRDLQAYICSTPIAWTKGGFSDVNNRVENYEPQMRKNARVNIR